jgi:spermidine/putrescine transport system substrate-binding protein
MCFKTAWLFLIGNNFGCFLAGGVNILTNIASLLLMGVGLLTACSTPLIFSPSLPTPTSLPNEIILCNYPEDIPQSVLEGFTAQTKIKVLYQSFDGMNDAVQTIRQGTDCDVTIIGNDFISELSQAGLLAKLNKSNLPNIKYLAPNFRDMMYDPQNNFSIPYNWGTSGLLYRSDLVQVTHWSDLWKPALPGKIGLWRAEIRDTIGLSLKSLGYSANSEHPEQINQAVERLIKLSPKAIFLDDEDQPSAAKYLAEGKVVIALGWAADAVQSRKIDPAIRYILPQEGAMLWGDNFVIPSSSSNSAGAEILINYFLRPEVSAQIANQNGYATTNQAALSLIPPEILNDPIVYPPNETLKKAEVFLPLSPQGRTLYESGWARFLESMDNK